MRAHDGPVASHDVAEDEQPSTTGDSGGRGDRWVLIGVGGVLVLIALVIVYVIAQRPDELATRDYARELCDGTLQTAYHDLDRISADPALQSLTSAELSTTASREKAITALRTYASRFDTAVDDLASFNDDHVITGNDGAVFRSNFTADADAWADDYDAMTSDIDALDPAAATGFERDIQKVAQQLTGVKLTSGSQHVVDDLRSSLGDRDSDCRKAFDRLTRT